MFRDIGFHDYWSVNESIIFSENTSLRSTVMSSFSEKVKFPVFEPIHKNKKSQIQEFLDMNKGPGTQHIAISIDDIIEVVENLRKRGVKFLSIPDSYYDLIDEKIKQY